jgi:hypothetical protein
VILAIPLAATGAGTVEAGLLCLLLLWLLRANIRRSAKVMFRSTNEG